MNNAKHMAKIAYKAMDDKLAKDIKIIDISEISVIADYFLIADGSNQNQVQAIAQNIEEEMHKAGYQIKSMDGYSTANWILLDYNDIIIHVFCSKDRSFYDLERIWKDGKELRADELDQEA